MHLTTHCRLFMALTLATWLATPVLAASPSVHLEYIAHSCFVIRSPGGVRLVIDPYSSHIWLGYSFPAPPATDAVLVTHPHFDHDASYYWADEVPTFRRPGTYTIGDVRLVGITGRHSDPYGKDFGQTNTIWVVETGGLRLAHLGDNGPLGEATIEALGQIDILMMPIDSTFHILKEAEVKAIRHRLRPRWTVPMHYLIPSLAELEDLGPIEPWLEGRPGVRRLDGHEISLSAADLPEEGGILVFQHHPAVEPWSTLFRQASEEVKEGREIAKEVGMGDPRVLVRLRKAVDLAPESIRFAATLARVLARGNLREEAIRVLERALAGAGRDDWATTAYARRQLAALYRQAGQDRLAEQQERLILKSSWQLELQQQARERLGGESES